jgi:hypothetical protein
VSRGRFQIEHWRSNAGAWEPMQDGPASSVWQPRETFAEAVDKALAWTGGTADGWCVPAMQVRDLHTGDVIWRASATYPEAGEPITPRIDRSEQLTMEVPA